jgi:hypothetical protein
VFVFITRMLSFLYSSLHVQRSVWKKRDTLKVLLKTHMSNFLNRKSKIFLAMSFQKEDFLTYHLCYASFNFSKPLCILLILKCILFPGSSLSLFLLYLLIHLFIGSLTDQLTPNLKEVYYEPETSSWLASFSKEH